MQVLGFHYGKGRVHATARGLIWVLAVGCATAVGNAQKFRPPAVPLVTHDPYFSIWSPADKLTDADTVHWTGKPHRLTSLVRIGGKPFRLMGKEPADVAALPQTRVEVLPTRTIYTFEGEGTRLKLTFLTPALPDDLMVCSRPVTYLAWEAESTGTNHPQVEIYFDASPEVTVNDWSQEVVWHTTEIEGLVGLCAGSVDQPVLQKKGDDLRIDWGHLYVAAPCGSAAQCGFVIGQSARAAFAMNGGGGGGMTNWVQSTNCVRDGALAFRFVTGPLGDRPVSRWLMLAYDDEYSIKYFRERLRPYWRHDGQQPEGLLKQAAVEYTSLAKRCADFDAELMADLRRLGGANYAQLCALAYRQTLAGNKIVHDNNGRPLMFPKENFSNGCIGTVDVLFPQAPFFLLFSPALTKAMLVPILDYAASPRWKFPYAPHDLGTYPHATGQVYGGGELTDENQMPVEESGNMLIMLEALARVEGSAELARKYWPQLSQWADYCVKEGLDPANQLCSADMFGHLPRCANLALKAIIAIGGYAQLCEMVGKPEQAGKYLGVARDYASKWRKLADDEGHTRLAYHLPGSWGMKHNLIWDRILGLGLFPDSVGDAEIAWYLKVQKPFGLPVDSRTDTCLIDWAMWSIALARRDTDFQTLLAPLCRYASQTPSRVPLSDWFVAADARQKGFQARPVVGGLFIKMLADQPTWTKWAKRTAVVTGSWAPAPIPSRPREVVATAQRAPVQWRYTLEQPGEGWLKRDFDDSQWREGAAAFGTKGTPGAPIRTEWSTKQIWLRREFVLPMEPLRTPRLLVIYDEDPELYLNGVLAARLRGWTGTYEEVEINPAALATLHAGANLLAVHATQTWGGQSIDVGLIEDTPAK